MKQIFSSLLFFPLSFLAHPLSQAILADLWMGGLRMRKNPVFKIILGKQQEMNINVIDFVYFDTALFIHVHVYVSLGYVSGLFFPPSISKLEFKTREELELMPQTEEELQVNLLLGRVQDKRYKLRQRSWFLVSGFPIRLKVEINTTMTWRGKSFLPSPRMWPPPSSHRYRERRKERSYFWRTFLRTSTMKLISWVFFSTNVGSSDLSIDLKKNWEGNE